MRYWRAATSEAKDSIHVIPPARTLPIPFCVQPQVSYDESMSDPEDLPDETSEDETIKYGTSETVEPAAAETPLPQPRDTQITIERFSDGLTMNVPPAGLWRGSYGLFAIGLVWVGFMAAFTPVFMAGLFRGQGVERGAALMVPAFLLLFWLVGIGMLLGGMNMGRRRAAIAVTSGTLMVLQTGIFGAKQRQWPATELKRICVGPSGMEVNNKPILELQIYGQQRVKFGLLAGRSDDELRWIASELRVALGVGEDFA
jgi:hypothetical protein